MKRFSAICTFLIAGVLLGAGTASAAWGDIIGYSKIGPLDGGFSGLLQEGDGFGYKVDRIGDLNNDGVDDLVVGARGIDDGGDNHGGFFVLFMNANGTVASSTRVSDTSGSPVSFSLNDRDAFTSGDIAGIGDLNGDGVEDVAVGMLRDSVNGTRRGAVYILFMNTDGTFSSFQKINETEGGFNLPLQDNDFFGSAIAPIGDLDDDGVIDLAVGASNSSSYGFHEGAVYVLFMNTNGTVKNAVIVNDNTSGFAGALSQPGQLGSDVFGEALDSVGDLDGDGNQEIIVGAYLADPVGSNSGTAFVIFFNNDGSVKAYNELDFNSPELTGTIELTDFFGTGIATIGDLNDDGFPEVAVYSINDDDAGTNAGAVYIFSLNAAGEGIAWTKFNETDPALTGAAAINDDLGSALGDLGDFNGDGCLDLLAGAFADDDVATNTGSVYLLYLDCEVGGSGALVAPEPGAGGALRQPSTTERTAAISWDAATDNTTSQEELRYHLWFSEGVADLSSLQSAQQNGSLYTTIVGQTDVTIDGLIPGREYTVNVFVEDTDGNIAAYEQQVVTTVDDGLPRGKIIRIGSSNVYGYIDDLGEMYYYFLGSRVGRTWAIQQGDVPRVTISQIRSLTRNRTALMLPAPESQLVQVGSTIYWVDASSTVLSPVLRPFENLRAVRDIVGPNYRLYTTSVRSRAIDGATIGDVIHSGDVVDVSRLLSREQLR